MNRATHILSILAFFASIISGQAALKYHVLAITPGLGQGINDKGDIVGTLTLASTDIYYQPKRAFLYKNGKITDLGVYNTPQDPYYESTEGQAVNNLDIVVGNISNIGGPKGGYTPGAYDSFSWKNGVMTDIAQGTSDGGATADAVGINAQGEAVGTHDALFLRIGFGIPHAYVSLNGVLTDLSTLGGENGNWSFGLAINNAGQAVGVSTNVIGSPYNQPGGFQYYAFLWSNGTMKAIGGAHSTKFAPTAINDNGWIAGTLDVSQVDGTYNGQAVLYVNSRFISLGAVKGFSGSQSLSMNDLGMVVGNLASGVPPYTPSVFVYNGVMHDLNTLVDGGWTITTVGKINIFGQIAATGTKAGSTTTYALLLTPSL
jgi:probable HAF family extracellular repeat protein